VGYSAKGMSVDDFLGAGFMDSDAEDEVRLFFKKCSAWSHSFFEGGLIFYL